MTIHLKAFTVDAIIGILPKERTTPQPVRIDLDATYTYRECYLDYAAVAGSIRIALVQGEFELLEEAAVNITRQLFSQYPMIETLTITLCKPEIMPDCTVGVTYHADKP